MQLAGTHQKLEGKLWRQRAGRRETRALESGVMAFVVLLFTVKLASNVSPDVPVLEIGQES